MTAQSWADPPRKYETGCVSAFRGHTPDRPQDQGVSQSWRVRQCIPRRARGNTAATPQWKADLQSWKKKKNPGSQVKAPEV